MPSESINTGGAADTTLYALLRSNLWHADSIFGRSKVSRFALPPEDDWTPINWQTLGPDSILYAAAKAGYVGIRIDNQAQRGDANFARTNPRGYLPTDRLYRTHVGNLDIKLLGHSGHMISGSRLLADFRGDSTAPYTVGYQSAEGRMPIPFREVHRAWAALFWGVDQDMDVMPSFHFINAADAGTYDDYEGINTPVEDALYGTRHGHILKFHAQDFSGGDDGLPARRPAWWAIKSIDNAMRAINAAAGYNVIVWAYPEDIDP